MTKTDRGEREKEEDGDNDGNLEFVCVIQYNGRACYFTRLDQVTTYTCMLRPLIAWFL